MVIPRETFIEHLQVKGLSKRTVKEYMWYYEKYLLMFGDTIDSNTCTKFILKYRINGKPFLQHLIKAMKLPIILERNIGKRKQRIPEVITKDDVLKIVQSIKRERERLMVLITFYGGLRKGELLTIKTPDFDWDEWVKDTKKVGKLQVIGKFDKQRNVYLPASLMLRVYKYIEDKELTGIIFPVSYAHWYKTLIKASRTALNRRINPHLLRHSSATYLMEQGMDLMQIKDFLGHVNLNTTQIYTHVSQEKLKEKYQSIVTP